MLPTLLSLLVLLLAEVYTPLCTSLSFDGAVQGTSLLCTVGILFNCISTKQRKHTDVHANHALSVIPTWQGQKLCRIPSPEITDKHTVNSHLFLTPVSELNKNDHFSYLSEGDIHGQGDPAWDPEVRLTARRTSDLPGKTLSQNGYFRW